MTLPVSPPFLPNGSPHNRRNTRREAEVEHDHFTNGRFRHGTKFLRWRPDKSPPQCTLDQVGPEKKSPLGLLDAKGKRQR
jgi:ATP-dependent DNA ligase